MIVIALVLFLLVWVQYVKNPVHQLSVFNNNFEQLFACIDKVFQTQRKHNKKLQPLKMLSWDTFCLLFLVLVLNI